MLLGDINRRRYEQYERGVEFYRRHPLGYKCKLGFLLFQSLAMALLLGGIIVLLCLLIAENPSRHVKLAVFLAVNVILSGWLFRQAIRDRPWQGMRFLPPDVYPGFYRKVNRIARIMGAPKIHRIYLSLEFNAAVTCEWMFIPQLRRNEIGRAHV